MEIHSEPSPAGSEPPMTLNSLLRARILKRLAIFFASLSVHAADSALTFVVKPSCTSEIFMRSGDPIGRISSFNFSASAALRKKSPFAFAMGTIATLLTFINVRTRETLTPLPPA